MKGYKRYVLGSALAGFLAFVLMAPAGSAEAFWGFGKSKKENNINYTGAVANVDSSSSVSSVPSSSITVVSPNGGETLQGGKSYTIKWKTKGISKKEKVSILLEVADDDRGISIATSTTNSGVYKWKVPGNVSGSNFKVAVTLKSVWDKSDEFFSITQKTKITVISPNGGENYLSGSTQYIKFQSDFLTEKVNLKLYAYLKGNEYQFWNIGESVTGGNGQVVEYKWTVPQDDSKGLKYKVYVELPNIKGVYDFSDSSFGIQGGLACFLAGTKIAMANGAEKNIENIIIGDYVKSLSVETGKTNNAKVIKIIKKIDPSHLTINNLIKTVPDQKMYTKDGFKQAQDLKLNDYLLNGNNEWVKVSDISPIVYENVETYDLVLDNGNTFYADGFLAHSVIE